MKILVTGLCTLHWGRLEYGNIGNYYIIEPLFRELHRVFPDAEITTTFQMTDGFAKRENITILPMELYYAWQENDIENAQKDYAAARAYHAGLHSQASTPYIDILRETSLVINMSGDMWGDNAEHVGHGRFLVDLLKMRTAQLLGVRTVLFGVTPGPFSDPKTVELAREVYENFDLIVNREPTSTDNLDKWGFHSEHVKDFACPAFLYTPELTEEQSTEVESVIAPLRGNKKVVGFTIGGFNMPVGPYDMWPREDSQYNVFAEIIEYLMNDLNAKVVLISHTNGFELPPRFKLISGRDYPILSQLKEVVIKRGIVREPEDLICISTPHLPCITKSIIGHFDMMVTGRVHASVAAVSQFVPTVFLTYEESFIPSSKMYGFADLVGMEEFVCPPSDACKIKNKIHKAFSRLPEIKSRLQQRIPEVKKLSKAAFDAIPNIEGLNFQEGTENL